MAKIRKKISKLPPGVTFPEASVKRPRKQTGTPRPETRSGRNDQSAPRPEEPMPETVAPVVEPDEVVLPSFDDLGLSETIRRAVAEAGFESPTPIQAAAIPVLLAGHDLIGQAQTGTGKTAAFTLPLLQRMDAMRKETQALVLVPTRELAIQAAAEIMKFARNSGLRVVPVYGGQPIDRQFRALHEGAQVVVGTPGRVQDHLRRGTLDLSHGTFCALDEADEMLAFGFIEDIESILAQLPPERQTALFSATMPPRILALTKKFLPNARRVVIETKRRTVETTNQTYYEVPPGKKIDALARVLDMETPGPTIVFCRTRQETNELAESLRLRGYAAEALHGEMGQPERDRVMRRFREGQADLLIATDVAARGLDIETVTHVINFSLPFDTEQYIHRVGRTGRAGRSGDAITLIEPRERRILRLIEQAIGTSIQPARIPTVADVLARRRERFVSTLRERLRSGDFASQTATVAALTPEFDVREVAAAALHMLWEETVGAPVQESEERLEEQLATESERSEPGMTRLFLPLGRQDGLRPADLVGAIAHETGLPGKAVGAIDIFDRTAFVEVPSENAQEVMDALSRHKLRGRRVRVTIARPGR
ncbi:MAG: DEAD/DEAH box helicase [Capsulimonadales bacterium]|nr:DEAD/DEAH box helicase [Capsulimonadales bacterium]